MRRRLTLYLVVLVACALLVAGAGAIVVSRSSARAEATSQLRRQAELFARQTEDVTHPRLLQVVARLLRLEDARVILVGPGGKVLSSLPKGVTARDVDAFRLLAGETTTGFDGNLSFAAAPVVLPLSVQTGLAPGERLAVVFTRSVGGLESSWVYLIVVGVVVLLIAAAVGAELSRRISKPLVEASGATGRMAGGELSARVEVRRRELPEIVSLATSINVLASSLEATRERENQLLLSVSHDLRTPLTSIRGFAEAIEEGVTDDPRGSARVIGREARRLERLVRDLLDLAKLRSEHLSLDISDVDAARVLSEVVAAHRPAATDRAVELVLDVPSPAVGTPSPAVFVRADPDRLSQIVSNLVENAVGFARSQVVVSLSADPGTATATGAAPAVPAPAPGAAPATAAPTVPAPAPGAAPVTAVSTRGACIITVTDDGPGIGAEDLERIFDRFYQVDRGKAARSGSGLGLSIVAGLVAAMGGEVDALAPVSATGGTQMVVRLLLPGETPLPSETPLSGEEMEPGARVSRPGAGGAQAVQRTSPSTP